MFLYSKRIRKLQSDNWVLCSGSCNEWARRRLYRCDAADDCGSRACSTWFDQRRTLLNSSSFTSNVTGRHRDPKRSFGLVTERRTTSACYVSSLICLPIRCPRSLQRTSYFSSSTVVSCAFSALCAGCLKTDIWINTAKFTIWTNIKILKIVKFWQSWFGQRNKNWHNQTKHSYLLDVDFSVIIRPPDICIGRLRFYRDSIFYLFFARYPRSSLNRTQLTPATCSEISAIWKRMSEIWGIPSPTNQEPKTHFFRRLRNLTVT